MSISLVSVLHYVSVAAFTALVSCAAYTDIRRLIIPNRLCLAILALYPIYAWTHPESVDVWGGLVVSVFMFAAGVVCFRFRLMGGGDAKLLTVVSLWAGPLLILPFVFVTTIVGGVLSLFWLSPFRNAVPLAPLAVGNVNLGLFSTSMPYGVAICGGSLYLAFRLLGY